jgi:hypothetical protein
MGHFSPRPSCMGAVFLARSRLAEAGPVQGIGASCPIFGTLFWRRPIWGETVAEFWAPASGLSRFPSPSEQ